MARDYKNSRKRGAASGLSGSSGLIIGLIIGLGIAAAVYVYDRRPAAEPNEKPKAAARGHAAAEEENGEDTGRQYDFYEMLPKFEVVVPEREKAEAPDARPAATERPGAFVLQVGSYRNFADADRLRAQLALQGIESKIQRVSVDSDTWHRVRIGPFSDRAELERTRARLKQADVEAIVVRVGEKAE